MTERDIVSDEILKLLSERGPMGWYTMERLLRVPRNEFREGYTLMAYLDDLEKSDTIVKTDDGKYKVA